MRWLSVLVCLTLLPACTATSDEPVATSLETLVQRQEELDGTLVLVEGTVRTYDQPRHYWIEDADLNRVELVPPEAAASHVGARVRVEGRFSAPDDRGRRIDVEDLEVLDASPEPVAGSALRSSGAELPDGPLPPQRQIDGVTGGEVGRRVVTGWVVAG